MGDMKRLFRDYQSLVRSLDSTFDGQLILPEDALNTDNLELKFSLKPNDGIYKDCEIGFRASLPTYPENAPIVHALSVVLHPNISFDDEEDDSSNVCLSLLDEWNDYEDDCRSLELLIQGLLFLFYEPNPEDALSAYGAFSSLEQLQEAVEGTKRGMDQPTDDDVSWAGITFSNIYKGPELVRDSEQTQAEGGEIDNSDQPIDEQLPVSNTTNDALVVTTQQLTLEETNKTSLVQLDASVVDVNVNIVSDVAIAEKTISSSEDVMQTSQMEQIDSVLVSHMSGGARLSVDSVFIKQEQECICMVFTRRQHLLNNQYFFNEFHRLKYMLRKTWNRFKTHL